MSNKDPQRSFEVESLFQQLQGAYAENTIRAYRADFDLFMTYCDEMGLKAFPADPLAVAGFVDQLSGSGLRSASIRRALSGIATVHTLSRLSNPTLDPLVKLAMRRMHRQLGRSARQAGAVRATNLEVLLKATEETLWGIRNRALLLVGYDTLCRRSELVSLDFEDLRPRKVLLRRSKTDPEGLGRWLGLSQRGEAALWDWIRAAGIEKGALFRGLKTGGQLKERLSAGQVNRIFKSIARRAGLDARTISGHSLRVGAAQDLLREGASLPDIMQRGRWSKTDTVMRYLENAQDGNAP